VFLVYNKHTFNPKFNPKQLVLWTCPNTSVTHIHKLGLVVFIIWNAIYLAL